jgi:hypothetical protein
MMSTPSDILSSLMGNKGLFTLGALVGATYLANRVQGRPGL